MLSHGDPAPPDAAVAAITADPFAPPPWLRGGHRQTVLGSLLPRRPLPRGERLWVASEPKTRILCAVHRQDAGRDRPALVVVHGMGGSIDSGPAVDLAWSGLRHGLDVVRMNMRNCGGTERETPSLYHANLHQDVLAVVRHLVDVVEDLHNFGPHYTKTLRAWNANFQRAWPTLRARYDERTRRMFEYFFLMVAGAFRARGLQNWHLVLTTPPTPQPSLARAWTSPKVSSQVERRPEARP